MKQLFFRLLLGATALLYASTTEAQDLRNRSTAFGRIEHNGDIRIGGSVKGRFETNGDIRIGGSVKQNEIKTTANKGFPKWRVKCFVSTFVAYLNFQLLINSSTKMPPLRQALNC